MQDLSAIPSTIKNVVSFFILVLVLVPLTREWPYPEETWKAKTVLPPEAIKTETFDWITVIFHTAFVFHFLFFWRTCSLSSFSVSSKLNGQFFVNKDRGNGRRRHFSAT